MESSQFDYQSSHFFRVLVFCLVGARFSLTISNFYRCIDSMAIPSTTVEWNGKEFIEPPKVHLNGQGVLKHDILILNKSSSPTTFKSTGGGEEGTAFSTIMDVSSVHQIVTVNGAVDGRAGRRSESQSIRLALNLLEFTTHVRALNGAGAMASVVFVLPPAEGSFNYIRLYYTYSWQSIKQE
ncbi:hypothetical protein PRIPAC_76309 [Pristionchus pacificus]|uniref:Uncharacterized protein n=1 Tax=Pristionchus pacificus TaxID=54126 RepID=A0A2A6BG47_PRIPA|nr:hypothetical protein PRIPAC_76309 [Pristionchus pacificus]|eukprot:PDM64857.1 hypothetical protein PRIPAC_53113 [Pristionchus pacificus]